MNEITRLLTDEQAAFLDKMALRYRISLGELFVTATLAFFEGSELDAEFDGFFMEDNRQFIQDGSPPRKTI